jgi:hypothetical protein
MKFATYAALVATVSAGNPNYFVSGDELEKFQRTMNSSAHAFEDTMKKDVEPNLKTWSRAQDAIE